MGPPTHLSFQMGDFEVCGNRFLHYFDAERWVNVEVKPFIIGQGLILQYFDLLIHFLEMPLHIDVFGIVGLRILRK